MNTLDEGARAQPSIIPAWAEAFFGEGPGVAPTLGLHGPVSRPWAYGDGSGRGVTVAVVDSGVDAEHPGVGSVEDYVAVERDTGADDDVRFVEGRHDDLFGHGTACAAIIRSLAPAVRLVSVRVLGADLKGSASAFAHGLEWCVEHAVDVVNLSLSTTNAEYRAIFHDLVDQAAFRNVLLVSAMNNERKRTIPSEFAGVFSVACMPGADRERLSFNRHAPAEWGAPGVDVEIAWAGGTTVTATGNSFAAPVVAGHLARLRGAHPDITAWQARTVLAELAANSPRPPVDARRLGP